MARAELQLMSALICLCCYLPSWAGDREADEWGEKKVGCQLSVRAEKAVYQRDETISLSVILRNTGDEQVWALVAEPRSIYQIKVLRPDGNEAAMTSDEKERSRHPRGGSMARVPVAPDTAIEDWYKDINRAYDMTELGAYTVVLTRQVITGNPATVHPIQSNRATIVIVRDGDAAATQPATRRTTDSGQ